MSISTKKTLDRRTLLRGTLGGSVAALALPPLEAMLDGGGTAFADGSPIPRRFGVWFWGNGVREEHWIPATTGRGWTPPASLKPLADAGVQEYVSVVTRTYAPTKGYWAHHTSYKTAFAAVAPIYPEPDYKGFPQWGGPRFDEIIRKALGGKTRFDGIALKVSRAVYPYLEGDTKSPRFNPQALFDQLFTGVTGGDAGGPSPSTWVVGMRRSVLDAVKADTADLRARLAPGDRARLDQHLDSVRSLERNLLSAVTAPRATCVVPPRPGARPPDMPGRREPLEEVNRAMADLVAYALACDLSRTFDFTFSGVQSEPVFWQVGVSEGHHALGHNEPGDQPMVQKTVVFIMQQLAYFLGKLKSIPVGAGNLLDHCCVFGTSEQNSPRGHSTFNMPCLVIGRAGGALRGGVHYQPITSSSQRSEPRALHTRVLLTMMRAMGLPQASFGQGPNQTASSISELEA